MNRYAIGLDIGITSVGWAAIALNEKEEPCAILDMGTRIFDAAEHPKTGASLAAPRREARGARRRTRRHRHRIERIRHLIISQGLLTEDALAGLFSGNLPDIYALRVKALDKAVTPEEFARVLIHIAQRRGFRSNRKNPEATEDGKLLEAVSENRSHMLAAGYRTVGEMFLLDPRFVEHKRNKGEYIATVGRDMVADEVRTIFTAQRNFGVIFASPEFEEAYLAILLSQRSFDEGPGEGSPYAGNQIERMVGRCTFEPDEPRAPKASYSFEYFTLLEKINHLRIVSDGTALPLTPEQRNILIENTHKSPNLTFASIRKLLSLPKNYRFNVVHYEKDTPITDCEKKTKFNHLAAYHKMRTAFDKLSKGYIASVSIEKRNSIARAFTLYKTQEKLTAVLSPELEPHELAAVDSLGNFSKFGHLSVKACDKIIPYLEQGMKYNEACAAAGYNFRGHNGEERSRLLNATDADIDQITSPVVRRAVAQTIKVVNAIIRKQGDSPVFINIELAREMAKDFSERNKLKKEMDQNHARNERIMERLRTEFGVISPTGQDLVKFRLYEEQGGVCAYSQKQMSLAQLFSPDYVEVDHIVPYSISFDDSYKNKVLVLAGENRNKGNRLPLQHLTGKRRDDFIVWVNACVRDRRKQQLLLKETITEDDEAHFRERNLQDTKTMSRFLYNYINDTLEFAPSKRKKRVTAVNGSITSYMRKRWGITKIREDGDIHHAVDALVIACTTNGMIQQITRYAHFRECQYVQDIDSSLAVDPDTGEVVRRFPYPWPQFRKELEARLSPNPSRAVLDAKIPYYVLSGKPITLRPVFVSRAPRRKVTGAAHKDTVKSPRIKDENLVIVKRPLTALKLDKNGEIENYYNPGSDRLLYEALIARLKAFGGNGEKAFAEPFHKPKSDGSPGPRVQKVKLCEKSTLNVDLHNGKGVAAHDSMVRIDVFHVENDGYYFVPIYVADTLKSELPSKACTRGKSYDEWKEMRKEDFLFSLYPNDLVRIYSKKPITLTLNQKGSSLPPTTAAQEFLLYYNSAGISTASLTCISHDNAYVINSLGIKTLAGMEKYTVDVLGEYHPVKKEVRQPFTQKRG